MASPIDTLKREHRIIERVLSVLDHASRSLFLGESVDPEALIRMVEFFRAFADGFHHAKEEALLFPALAEHGVPVQGGPIGCMTTEHELGRALVAELDRLAHGLAGGDQSVRRRFVEVAQRYISLLSEHIHKEDNVLFRIAESVLDSRALASLDDSFQSADIALSDVREKYETVANELESELAAGARKMAGSPVA